MKNARLTVHGRCELERVPLHDREMEISIQYHVMLIHQSNDQILMRCYIITPS